MVKEKECEFYCRLYNIWKELKAPFNSVIDTINSGTLWYAAFLDIDNIRNGCNSVLDFLAMVKRMSELQRQYDCIFSCEKTGFKLDGHSFETLDEVERALKMKAFM